MRPTELGELKIVTGDESWSYSTEAGRGIAEAGQAEARGRRELARERAPSA